MKITRFPLPILLSAMLVLTAGCGIFFPPPDWHPFTTHTDPLAGWKGLGFESPNKTITDDYQDYIQKLPPIGPKGYYVGTVQFFEDGTGQHAVEFEMFQNNENASWHYVLIYDKENKRIKG